MRLFSAALFVFIGTLAAVGWVFSHGAPEPPMWHIVGVALGAFSILFVIALILFNSFRWPPAFSFHVDSIEELEAKGLLQQEDFQAQRAFQVEEFEDEGSQYMIELQDGSVLFLIGQYLYEYEPITDDPEPNQPRRFPCTEFTVRRHKETGDALDILCRGEVLEPECLAPGFDREDFKDGWIPEDGIITRDKAYDEIKRERMGRKKKTGAQRR